MDKKIGLSKGPFAFGTAVLAAICVSLVTAQEIVPVENIGGGTSVFYFAGAAKSVARKQYATKTRPTKTQRIETAKKVTKQYSTLAKVTPRRTRTEVVDPNDPRLKDGGPRMDPVTASRLFAGVGEYYMNRDNYDKSIDFFREAIQLDGTNAIAKSGLSEALSLKGNELLAKDSFPVARKFFEESLIYNPRNAPAYFGLGEVLTELNDEPTAAANYEKALSFDRDLTEIYVPLGILYYQQGEIPKAENLIVKAVAIDANDPQTQYYLGLIRQTQPGRDKEALTAFNKAKTLDPSMAEAFYWAGHINTKLNNNSEAVKDFQKAIALRSNYFEAWFGLGSAYFDLDNFAEAKKAYEQAKRLKNDNAEVVANLGDVYRQMGDFNQAESNYNLAAIFFERQKDFGTNKEARNIAAETYGKRGFAIAKQCEANIRLAIRNPCKWDTAVASIEKAVAFEPNSVNLANLGWAQHNAGKADIADGRTELGRQKLIKARDNLMRAIDAKPVYLEGPMLNLGMVYTDLGDYPNAIDTLKKVIQKEPKWVFAINELGIAYLNSGNTKEAVTQFKKAVGRDGKFAAAYFNLAKAEFKNGNLGEAQKAHSKLKSLGAVGAKLANQLTVETGGAVRS